MISQTKVDYKFNTRLDGNIAITSSFHENRALQKDSSLYKFLWVRSGSISIEVDHVKMTLHENEIIPLTPLHHLDIDSTDGEYITVLFNSNFYCIFGHDDEVSCSGFLFHGSSHVMVLQLTEEESRILCSTIDDFIAETMITDRHQEEMLRILLKRFIIICTRIARKDIRWTKIVRRLSTSWGNFMYWSTTIIRIRSVCRIMRICYSVRPKHYPTCLPVTNCRHLCASFTNGWGGSQRLLCIPTKAQRK